MKTTVNDLSDLTGKRVLTRVDFNVPMDKKTGAISNDRRIRGAIPTIKLLLDKGAAVIVMTHVGRPSGDTAKDAFLRTDKIAERFSELLGRPVKKAGDTVSGAAVATLVQAMKPGDVAILENLRFDPREQKNEVNFAGELAAMADIYVNDAFGTCHNDKDTSMVGVPRAMKLQGKPRVVGLLVAKELEIINGLMSSAKRPLLGVMGGAKVSDKIAFINALLAKVDHLLIGGKMAFTFMKARGESIGDMAVPEEELAAAKNLLQHIGAKITLPVDALCAKTGDLTQTQVVAGPIPVGWVGVDIGPKSLAMYTAKIADAGTVIWNGPVGWFEQAAFSGGTKGIAQAMANSKAVTVVGGGETAEAVEQFGFDKQMTHVSTGGGAFLAYIEGKNFASLAEIDDHQ